MDKAQTGGVQVVATIDKQPFQDAVKPVWDKYGPHFAELVKRIQARHAKRATMVPAIRRRWTCSMRLRASSPAPLWS